MNALKTIMIIDDEAPVRDVVRLMLEHVGFKTLEAGTGLEALDLLQNYPDEIDLSIMDMGLPDIEGPRLYPLMMNVRPGLKTIVFSGNMFNGTVQEVIDSGAQDYIQKPFSYSTLYETLQKVLELK